MGSYRRKPLRFVAAHCVRHKTKYQPKLSQKPKTFSYHHPPISSKTNTKSLPLLLLLKQKHHILKLKSQS